MSRRETRIGMLAENETADDYRLNNTRHQRVVAVDVFRGLTIICMIIANTMFVFEMIGDYSCFSILLHKKWDGVTFADTLFPFFAFLMGVSVVLSFSRKDGQRLQLVSRGVWRAIKLFLLGFTVEFVSRLASGLDGIRFMGVLQRLAIIYLACILFLLFCKWKTQVVVAILILVSYWLAMTLIALPSLGAGVLEPGENLAAWIDHRVIPGTLNNGTWDSEGLMSTIPAVVTGMTGMFAGYLIISRLTIERKINRLFLLGFVCIVIGQLWNLKFAINKNLWTSSFVLYTSGWAYMTLASLTWLSDCQHHVRWSRSIAFLGRYSLLCYVLHFALFGVVMTPIRNDTPLMASFVSSLKMFPTEIATLLFSFVIVGVCYGIVFVLYWAKTLFKSKAF